MYRFGQETVTFGRYNGDIRRAYPRPILKEVSFVNEQDRMKEDSARQDSSSRPSGDGCGYTNPDGSHGFIYNDRPGGNGGAGTPSGTGARSGVLVVLTAIAVVLLIGGACFGGAYMAARSLYDAAGGDAERGESAEGTSDGLYISDDTRPDEHTTVNDAAPNSGDKRPDADQVGTTSSPDLPNSAGIQKLPAERTDTDGDGRADVVFGPDGEVLTSAGENAVSVATVVARVGASVVEITTETVTQSGFMGQYIQSGAGSGVVISADGYIVTNNHVIEGASTITVRMSDGTEFPALLVGTDEETDVAVLWIDRGSYSLTVATLGSSYDLVVGEDILAIGNPLGSLGGTVTEGMISATAREINVGGSDMTLLQVSAPINPGNSGGGLFNLAGELVGVVNAKMSSEEIEGLGFAIPVDTAYAVIVELIEHGYVRGRPALGFDVVDVTSTQTAIRYFNSFYTGVYVYDDTTADLPVKMGDLILSVDGTEISSVSDLNAVVQSKAVGDTLSLTVYRNKEKHTVTVTLVERVPDALSPAA